jgi:hypothetical protein
VTVKADEVSFIAAEASHTATNVGSGPGAELATYVVQREKPIVLAADPPL